MRSGNLVDQSFRLSPSVSSTNKTRSKPRGFAKPLFAVSTAPKVMPKIRRRNVPPALIDHLLDRIRSREISADQIGELAAWLDTEPEVPIGKWFKRFRAMIACGEGKLIKAFLRPGQAPAGDE